MLAAFQVLGSEVLAWGVVILGILLALFLFKRI